MNQNIFEELQNFLGSKGGDPEATIKFIKKFGTNKGLLKANQIKILDEYNPSMGDIMWIDPIADILLKRSQPDEPYGANSNKIITAFYQTIKEYVLSRKVKNELSKYLSDLSTLGIDYIISNRGDGNCVYIAMITSLFHNVILSEKQTPIRKFIKILRLYTTNFCIFDDPKLTGFYEFLDILLLPIGKRKYSSDEHKSRIFLDFCGSLNEDMETALVCRVRTVVALYLSRELAKYLNGIPDFENKVPNYVRSIAIPYINSYLFDIILFSFIFEVNVNFVFVSMYGIETCPIKFSVKKPHINILIIRAGDSMHAETFVYDKFPIKDSTIDLTAAKFITKREIPDFKKEINKREDLIKNLSLLKGKNLPKNKKFHKFLLENLKAIHLLKSTQINKIKNFKEEAVNKPQPAISTIKLQPPTSTVKSQPIRKYQKQQYDYSDDSD